MTTCSDKPPRRLHMLVGAVFGLGWVVPLGVVALLGYPPASLPPPVRDQLSVTCLFSQRAVRWDVYGIEVMRRGQPGWRTLDTTEHFAFELFGHRTRFDRFMDEWGSRNVAARDELAHWLADRDRVQSDDPPIVAVRFMAWKFSPDQAPPPHGHWTKQGAIATSGRPFVISSHAIEEGP
jgi:hypothetical protein